MVDNLACSIFKQDYAGFSQKYFFKLKIYL